MTAPKTTALDALSSDHYYVIRSANPRTAGFVASMKNGVVEAEEVASAAVTQDMPSVLWKVVRQDDGSFVLINKTEQQYAVVHKSSNSEKCCSEQRFLYVATEISQTRRRNRLLDYSRYIQLWLVYA